MSNDNLKWFSFSSLGIALIAVVIAIMSISSHPKIGYVDSSTLLQEFSGAKNARADFQKKTDEWQSNIKILESELQTLNQEILANNDSWAKSLREEKQKAFRKKQGELAKYNNAINSKASQLELELMEPVFNELNSYFEEYGKLKGYDLIFGTVTGGNILHGSKVVNLTKDVLDYIENQ